MDSSSSGTDGTRGVSFADLEAQHQSTAAVAQSPEIAVLTELLRLSAQENRDLRERLGQVKTQLDLLHWQNERWEETRESVQATGARLETMLDRIGPAVDRMEAQLRAAASADQARTRALNATAKDLAFAGREITSRLGQLHWRTWTRNAALLVSAILLLVLGSLWTLNRQYPRWNLSTQERQWLQDGRWVTAQFRRMTPAQQQAYDRLLKEAGETTSAP